MIKISQTINNLYFLLGFANQLDKIRHDQFEKTAVEAREEMAQLEKLESENAELKAQHDRDEKEKCVLAEALAHSDEFCRCGDYNGHIDCWLAYAKQEAGK